MNLKNGPRRIVITTGDPAGIGPEIVGKALRSRRLPKGFEYIVVGADRFAGIEPGKLSKKSAMAAYLALEDAFVLWRDGIVSAIVTAPIHKENMARLGFEYPGHTEYFAAKCGVPAKKAVMCFHSGRWSLALASTHCSLKDAVRGLNREKIVAAGKELVLLLKKTGIQKPRIALAGLNPHAGEGGLFGREEIEIIKPAVRALMNAGGADVSGPWPADALFADAEAGRFDGVVAMYHDQGLVPFKLLHRNDGVNVTMGLPLVRTSPDHGTAVEIAGKNMADAGSMIAAISLACTMQKEKDDDKKQW